MSAIRNTLATTALVVLCAFGVSAWLFWRLLWSWRHLIPSNRHALAAIRNEFRARYGVPAKDLCFVRVAKDRCYVKSMMPLGGVMQVMFGLWCYDYNTGRVAEAATFSGHYAGTPWRVWIEEYERTGECVRP